MTSILGLFMFDIIVFGRFAVDTESTTRSMEVNESSAKFFSLFTRIRNLQYWLLAVDLSCYSKNLIIRRDSSTVYLSVPLCFCSFPQSRNELLQLSSVGFFFVLPLSVMIRLMLIDTRNWPGPLLFLTRATIIVTLSIKPLTHSLIFLVKSPALRK
ncbi:hypothetical protein PMAYCL1PPCAC_17026, partial [Pristionchus mayeri]